MDELKSIKRPHISLVKLVEAIGILLRLEKKAKSIYKVPSPSTYENVIDLMSNDFYGCLDILVQMKSESINNEVSSELYEKTLEPGFNFDEAIVNGGLCCKEMFDALNFILNKLQKDVYRLPVVSNNVFVIVNGSRPSMIALDVATHIFNHGICIAGVLNLIDNEYSNSDQNELFYHYLRDDIKRRFKFNYKLSEHRYKIEKIAAMRSDAKFAITEAIDNSKASLVVLGIYENDFDDTVQKEMINWMFLETNLTAIFVKNQTLMRSFQSVVTPKCFLICVKSIDGFVEYLNSALSLLRPTDSYTVLHIAETPLPLSDYQDTRFDYGSRYGWVDGIDRQKGRDSIDWNKNQLNDFRDQVEAFIKQSQLSGKFILSRKKSLRSVPQDIIACAIQENTEMIILKKSSYKHTVLECIQHSNCSVTVIK